MNIRILLAILLAFGQGAAASSASAQETGEETAEALEARIQAGHADPEAEARQAAAAGHYGMVMLSSRYSAWPIGVHCYTPYRLPPATLVTRGRGAIILDEDGSGPTTGYEPYGERYNRTLIDAPGFPFADLCGPSDQTPDRPSGIGGLGAVDMGARVPARAPVSLHEAARRGAARDIRRRLGTTDVDALDPFGMTALAWAVARDRPDIVDLLLAAGADPVAGEGGANRHSAVMVAIVHGHVALLDRMLAAHPALAATPWTRQHVFAAHLTKNPAMIRRIYGSPHDPPLHPQLESLSPSLEAAEALLEFHGKTAADAFLATGARRGRLDLMRLALDAGADPDFESPNGGGRPLGSAVRLYGETRNPGVRMLLDAGADVNLRGAQGRFSERVIWHAVRYAIKDDPGPASPEDEALIRMLLDAGADVRSPDVDDIPPVWTVLFAPRVEFDELGSAPPPWAIVMLARHGMDLNVRRDGRRALDVVQEQQGPDSPLAVALREAGALP